MKSILFTLCAMLLWAFSERATARPASGQKEKSGRSARVQTAAPRPDTVRLAFDVANRSLSMECGPIVIRDAAFSAGIVENGQFKRVVPEGEPIVETLMRTTPLGPATETVYTWTMPQGYQLKYKVTRVGRDKVILSADFVNGTLTSVYLRDFRLLETADGGVTVTGNAADWMLATTDIEARRWGTLDKLIPTETELNAEKAFNRGYLLAENDPKKVNDRAWRGYRDDMTLYSASGQGLSMAAVGVEADVYFDVKAGGTLLQFDIFSDMSEVLVESGESRGSDEILISFSPWAQAQAAKDHWIASVTDVRLTKKPVYGWCSWYRSMRNITQEDILKMTEYFAANRDRMPIEVLQVDDGWQEAYYNWKTNKKFTLGMDSISNRIRQAGMTPGVWLSPVSPNPGWERGGWLFPVEYYAHDKDGAPDWERLDPTHPGVASFITTTLRDMCRQGYSYYKLDFNNLPLMSKRFHNPKMTRLQAQRELFRLYREAIGDESYLMACNPDQRLFAGYADANRIGPDCLPFEGFTQHLASDGLPANIWGLYYPILSMASRGYQNRVTTVGDPDVTYLGQTGKARPAQLLTYHSFIGIYGGLAMTSDHLFDPKFGSQQSVRMMEQMYPVSREAGHSFSGGYDMCGKEFGYVADRPYGRSISLILWNPLHDQQADLTMTHVPTDTLGDKFHVWSLWDERYKGVHNRDYTVKDVAPYEHKLLRLTELSDGPVLLGSNLHISMGATEVRSMTRQGDRLTIELDPQAGARSGKLFFYSERPVSSVTSTNSEAFACKVQDHVYVVTLSGRQRDKKEIVTLTLDGTEVPTEAEFLRDEPLAKKYAQASFDRTWLQSW